MRGGGGTGGRGRREVGPAERGGEVIGKESSVVFVVVHYTCPEECCFW